jgi:hypothetical protein
MVFRSQADVDAEVVVNISAWEIYRENIKISDKQSLRYYELKQHKPWFNENSNY